MQKDFLSSLTSRAIHASEPEAASGSLRPRLASLFEPPMVSIMPDMQPAAQQADLAEAESIQAAPTRLSSRPPNQVQAQKQSHPSQKNDISVQRDSAPQYQLAPNTFEHIRVEKHIEFFHSVTPPETVQASLETHTTPKKEAKLQQQVLMPPARPDPAARAEMQQTLENLKRQVNKKNTQSDAKTVALQQPAYDPVPSHDLTTEKQVKPKIAPEQIVITRKDFQMQKVENQPNLIPALTIPERGWQANMPQNKTQADTIHVTIGRIEVKASVSQAVTKRAAPSATTMSLDEYLRRRQGGNQ